MDDLGIALKSMSVNLRKRQIICNFNEGMMAFRLDAFRANAFLKSDRPVPMGSVRTVNTHARISLRSPRRLSDLSG
jgi:hypothetical protein